MRLMPFLRSMQEGAFRADGSARWGKPRGMPLKAWGTMQRLMRQRQACRQRHWNALPWWQRIRYLWRGVTWATLPAPDEPNEEHIMLGVDSDAEKDAALRRFMEKETQL